MKSLALSMLALALSLSSLQAVTVFHWGGNYVSSTATFGSGNGSQIGGFTAGNPNSLVPASGYSGGPAFYGMVTASGSGAIGTVVQNGSADQLQFKLDNQSVRGLILFKQADFAAGYNTGNLVVDDSLEVRLNLSSSANFSPGGRLVIRLEGGSQPGYYISQSTPFNGSGSVGSGALTSLTWYAYDPASSLAPADASIVNLVSGGVIENVTEVGYYAFSPGTAVNAFRVNTFDFQTIVPEPSASLALAGGGLALMLVRRRRHQRG